MNNIHLTRTRDRSGTKKIIAEGKHVLRRSDGTLWVATRLEV